MTLASGDPTLTFELVVKLSHKEVSLNWISGNFLTILPHRLKEFIKEQLVSIPTVAQAPTPAPPAAPPTPQIPPNDPAALLADLL